MSLFLRLLSWLGLALTVLPSFLAFYGVFTFAQHKLYMLIGTGFWFATAPFWLGKKSTETK